jgi:uncharacterized delta-60 repeat protein
VTRLRRLVPVALSTLTALLGFGAAPAVAGVGDLDPTWGGTGVVRTDFLGGTALAQSVLVQSNGKVLVVGTVFTPHVGSQVAVARYLPTGRLDQSYGVHGRVLTRGGSATDAALQADGKLVVSFWSIARGTFQSRFGIVRYMPNGTRDASFGTKGKVTLPFGTSDAIGWSVAVAPSGKIVVAGQRTTPDGNHLDLCVARYRPNGSPDRLFGGGDGRIVFPIGRLSFAQDVAVLSDGRILAGGESDGRGGFLARFAVAGPPDPRFGGGDGLVTSHGNKDLLRINAVALQSGSAIVAGTGKSGAVVARFDGHGELDQTFGAQGFTTFEDDSLGALWDVELDSAGKVVAGGYAIRGGALRAAVVRLRPGGARDGSFGYAGVAVARIFDDNHEIRGIALEPSGDILAAIHHTNTHARLRMVSARFQGGSGYP